MAGKKGQKRPREERSEFQARSTSQPLKVRSSRSANVSDEGTTQQLPMRRATDALLRLLSNHKAVVLVAETGSGKSTQVPQILLEAGVIGNQEALVCTQPRRMAAITLARRVASEKSCKLGQEVGYCVRFDDTTSSSTAIKYATDGILLREAMSDPLLGRYKVIILDEAHERSLQTDLLFGLVRQLQSKRDDLKVIVMSATLNVGQFVRFFDDARPLKVSGRQHPVQVYYTCETHADFVDTAFLTALQIHESEEWGDVLIFLPGQEEIERLQQLLETHFATNPNSKGLKALIRPIFAAASFEQQDLAFSATPEGHRKFVISTNIAETSVTISGVRFVVDSGRVKERVFTPSTGMDSLQTVEVSQQQANQRKGRAGREFPGKCWRLFTESSFEALSEATVPEIQRVDLAEVILQLKAIGVRDVQSFDLVAPPSLEGIEQATTCLLNLGALDKKGMLTQHGRRLALLPLAPKWAHTLATSQKYHSVKETLTCVAMLSAENVFVSPTSDSGKVQARAAHKELAVVDGDIPTLIRIFDLWVDQKDQRKWSNDYFISWRSMQRASKIRDQLEEILRGKSFKFDTTATCFEPPADNQDSMKGMSTSSLPVPQKTPDGFMKTLAAGLFMNTAFQMSMEDRAATAGLSKLGPIASVIFNQDGVGSSALGVVETRTGGKQFCNYRTVAGHPVDVHPSSVLFGRRRMPSCVVYSEIVTTTRPYMRNVMKIDESHLIETCPAFFTALKRAAAAAHEAKDKTGHTTPGPLLKKKPARKNLMVDLGH